MQYAAKLGVWRVITLQGWGGGSVANREPGSYIYYIYIYIILYVHTLVNLASCFHIHYPKDLWGASFYAHVRGMSTRIFRGLK